MSDETDPARELVWLTEDMGLYDEPAKVDRGGVMGAYDCQGTPFKSQREAAEAAERVKAAATRTPQLELYRCDIGHWHYR